MRNSKNNVAAGSVVVFKRELIEAVLNIHSGEMETSAVRCGDRRRREGV